MLPPRRHIDTLELRPWLGELHLLDVEAGGLDFRYRIFAKSFAEDLGGDLNGRRVSDTPEPVLRAITLAAYRRATAAGCPLLARRPLWDCVVLPLADNGRSVDRLLVLTTRLEEAARDEIVTFVRLDPIGVPLHVPIAALIDEAEAWVEPIAY